MGLILTIIGLSILCKIIKFSAKVILGYGFIILVMGLVYAVYLFIKESMFLFIVLAVVVCILYKTVYLKNKESIDKEFNRFKQIYKEEFNHNNEEEIKNEKNESK